MCWCWCHRQAIDYRCNTFRLNCWMEKSQRNEENLGMQSGQQQRTSFNVELVAEKFVCLWWHLTSVRQSMHSADYGRLWPCHETERKCGKRFMSSCDIFTLHEVALNWFQSQKRTSDVVNCAGRWSFGWSIPPSVRPFTVVLVSVAGGWCWWYREIPLLFPKSPNIGRQLLG